MSLTLALRRASEAPAAPAPRVAVNDAGLAVLVLVVEVLLAALLPEGAGSHRPDPLGWALLVASAAVLVWRRRAPMLCLIGMVAAVAPYHYLENIQEAPLLSSAVALYALAVAGPHLRTFVAVPIVVCTMAGVMSTISEKPHAGTEMLRSAGWIVAVAVVGEVVRMQRIYVAAITERAERAERTREEEAARRVAEERLRIARDLHDLLAHSITLIGVQTSVAAHILVADPDRLDRTAVAGALDAIADTCREARAELRTTLRVLRADGDGPLPGLDGLPSLVQAAQAAGARVELAVDAGAAERVPPAVGAAAYRIVQESLTNAVRHAGPPGPLVAVRVSRGGAALRLLVQDDGGRGDGGRDEGGRGDGGRDEGGRGDGGRGEGGRDVPAGGRRPAGRAGGGGFGILGMRERARSVGGTLDAGPRTDGPGFAVTAELPLGAGLPFGTEPEPESVPDGGSGAESSPESPPGSGAGSGHGSGHGSGAGSGHGPVPGTSGPAADHRGPVSAVPDSTAPAAEGATAAAAEAGAAGIASSAADDPRRPARASRPARTTAETPAETPAGTRFDTPADTPGAP